MPPVHPSWRIVLVRPRNPLNIGAAARAMANFGFDDLVVVEPYEPVWKESRAAVGANQVMARARAAASLAEAIQDRTLVVGTTTGRRRNLGRELIALEYFRAWVKRHRPRTRPDHVGARAALLFGSEKTGLSNEALSYCHALVRIPTSERSPSMNLGQAVAVCCYELDRSRRSSPRNAVWPLRRSDPASLESLDHLLERVVRILDSCSYFTPKTREARLLKLRRLLLNLDLSHYDARVMGGAVAQIEWKLGSSKIPS